MRKAFADTFYYLALLSPRDEAHGRATDVTSAFDGEIITTDWVLTELADGLASAGTRAGLVGFLRELRQDSAVHVVAADRQLFEQGLELFTNRMDKEWSLTDCISFVVMRAHGVTDALTGDHHFEQAGFVALLSA